jgi:hypothetical protein
MSLLIVVGYDGPGASAKPFPVYMGRVRSEADAAMAASTAVRFGIIRNPVELRKNGKPSAPAPVVAADPQPETVEPLPFSEPAPEAADIEPAETTTDTPSEDPDPDSPAPAGISGKRRK